jgi:DNA-directed RNA polymerase specialized sigma subunit
MEILAIKDDAERVVLYMRYVQKLTFREIAARLHVSVRSAYRVHAAAFEKIKKLAVHV